MPATSCCWRSTRSGAVVARSDTFAAMSLPDVRTRWLEPALSGQPVYGLLEIEGRAHHLALVPAESGGTIFGFVAAGRAGGRTLGRGAQGGQRPRDRGADTAPGWLAPR